MNWKKIEKNTINLLKKIKDNYIFGAIFILFNLINGLLLRINTVNNGLRLSPLLIDLGILILISQFSLLIKKKKRVYYYIILTIILTLICIVNSVYYHYYSSFASISILANITFANDVKDAIFQNVLKIIDLIYLWCPIAYFIFYKCLKKKENIKESSISNKKITKKALLTALIIFIFAFFTMPLNAWGRLYKLWNRESVVMNFGIYTYQLDDFIQSLTPKLNSIFGYDSSLKKATEFYEKNKENTSLKKWDLIQKVKELKEKNMSNVSIGKERNK